MLSKTNSFPSPQRGLPPCSAHALHLRRGHQLEERRRPRRRLHPLSLPRRRRRRPRSPARREGRPPAGAPEGPQGRAPGVPAALPSEPAQRLLLVPGIHAGIGAVRQVRLLRPRDSRPDALKNEPFDGPILRLMRVVLL